MNYTYGAHALDWLLLLGCVIYVAIAEYQIRRRKY